MLTRAHASPFLALAQDAHTLGNLLRYGADPDAADYDGRSALMIAAAEDAKDCIRELLEVSKQLARACLYSGLPLIGG